MGKKRDELSNPHSCLNKAHDDEPIFVLRGQDKLAANHVRHWARLAKAAGTPIEKVNEALLLALEMEEWHTHKTPD